MKKLVKIFKHIFIPHVHNDYKPHFFREVSIVSILVVVIVLFSFSLGSKIYINKTGMTSAVLPAVLVDLANQDRTANGEPSLKRNDQLDQAATLKAQDMATNQYFAHTSPSGVTPWYWFGKVGYYFTYAGENLAIDFSESTDVENAWLNSPKHKENIMSNNFTEIGIATAEGYYNGTKTTYVVQMFGTPAFIKKAEASPTVTPVATPISTPIVAKAKPTAKKTTVVKLIEVAVAPVVTPIVKGESTEVVTVPPEKLKVVKETNNSIFVENTDINNDQVALQTPTTITPSPTYSTWKERLLFFMPSYTDRLYKIFFYLIIVALFLMTVIEVRRQHPKNIAYGILLVVIIFCLIYINKIMFVTTLLI